MPKALALESNPLGRINELSSLLSDRYPLASVLKEWIQNADDAGATRVIVASTLSPSGCTHELLQEGTPAVVVLNDGKFTEADSRAIRQFGLNDKVGDGAAIGKFGLGLKSVFHLCEAFFFLSPTAPAADPNGVFNNLVCPWAGTEHHAHWGDVDAADLDRLRAHLEPACHQLGTQWFALWLPLRQPGHTAGDCILDRIYSSPPDELFRPPDAVHFGPSMALLKQVESIELGNASFTSGTVREQRWELRTPGCRANYTRWATADQTPATAQDARRGECGDGGTTLWYALAEAWRNEAWTEAARAHPDWPKRRSIGGTRHPDKARPHAAVVLTRRHGREDGKLHDSPAVFLPLSAGANDHKPEDAEFLLLRHGCFFVDSGRGGVYAGDGVRGEWNRQLMRDGVLPLIVPAVDKLAEVCDEAAKRRLTAAVQRWMNADDREHVCRNGGWAYRWRPGGVRWETIPNGVRVLEIPAFPEHGLPACALPGLTGLADDYALVPAAEPRLLARDPEPWPDDLLGRVLAVPEAQPLLDGAALGYLVEFVKLTSRQFGASARQSLAATLRRMFAAASNGELSEHKDRLVRLVGEVPPEYRRRLSLGGNWPAKTRQAVCGVEAGILIVPDGFDPAHAPGVGLFATPDAVGVLKLLAADMSVGRNTNPAAEVVDASADPVPVCEATADLALWQVQCPKPQEKRDRTELRSRNELVRARDSGTLFGGEAKEELKELAAAVAVRLIVLKAETAKSLLLGPLPEVSAAGITEVLMNAPDLHPAEARLPLILRLTTATDDDSFRTRRRWAVRYLLHADKELPSKDDLYLPAAGAEVIGKVARAVLERQGSAGRLLQTETLTASLNDQQRSELGLVKLDWDGLARLLSGQQTAPDVSFDDAEQDQLLDGLRNHKHAIRLLPLHDRADGGGRVPLTDGCYWRTNEKVDLGTLAAVVTLLKPHHKKSHVTTQTEAGGIELTVLAVVDLAIQHDPATNWPTLLTAMASAGILKEDRAEPLKKAPWLPLSGGAFVAPNQVLHDEQLNDVIADAVKRMTEAAGDPVPQAKLDERVRKHDGFKALARLFPDRGQTLSKLGGLFGRDPRFHVGKIDDMDAWCEAFRRETFDMAAAPLVIKVHQCAPDECRDRLLPALSKSPPADRVEKILVYLRGRFGQADGKEPKEVERVHNLYLKQLAAQPNEAQAVLPRLKLLNQNGEWVETAKLCIAAGIDQADSLDTTQAGILGGVAKRQVPKSSPKAPHEDSPKKVNSRLEVEFTDSAKKVREFFDPWRKADEQLAQWVGAFVALLGSCDLYKPFAEECLGDQKKSVEKIWNEAGMSATAQRMSRQRFLVEVSAVKGSVPVLNLLGQQFQARAATDTPHFLFGYEIEPFAVKMEDWDVHHLHLRVVDPVRATNAAELGKLRRLLEGTAEHVLTEVYGERNASLKPVLDDLAQGELADVRIAQAELLDAAGHYLRTLGLIPELKPVLDKYQDVTRRRAEEGEAGHGGRKMEGTSADDLARDAQQALREVLTAECPARAKILDGLRVRLGEKGYRPGSVLFELFQNADDAYSELGDDAPGRFGVSCVAGALTVVHAGRRINHTVTPGRGQDRDLSKMLALHHSDKGAAADVTGRFGLGFKSVFLVCDHPRVVCGRLAFEVLGGVYPAFLPQTDAAALRDRADHLGLRVAVATVFELRLLADVEGEVLGPFRRLAYLLPVFARCIRKIKVNDAEFTWSPTEILTTTSASVVVGRLDTDSDPRRALVIRCGELGDVLFGLSDDGFAAMPTDVPSVWVTAPTAEEHRLGYVVNARELPIDIGRSQVAWTHPDAGRVLRGLATAFGEALVALFDAGVTGLGVSAGASAVWRSFWEVVKTEGERGELREGLMWGPNGAARRLFTERQTLSTGLDAPGYNDLTSLGAVRGVVGGVMDQQTEVFLAVTGWASFRVAHPPGSLVAASQAGDLLPELPSVDLSSAVGLEMRTPHVDPSRAGVLGHVLNRDRLNKWSGRGGEIERVKEALTAAQFGTAAGAWAFPAELVAAGAKGEEALRAAFAPPDRVLAPAYTGTAVDFFQACRGDMQAGTEVLEGWVHNADTQAKRNAALRYLAQGELRQPLLVRLRLDRSRWTWLNQLTREQMQAAGLNELEQAQLAAATSPPTAPVPPLPPRPRPVGCWNGSPRGGRRIRPQS